MEYSPGRPPGVAWAYSEPSPPHERFSAHKPTTATNAKRESFMFRIFPESARLETMILPETAG